MKITRIPPSPQPEYTITCTARELAYLEWATGRVVFEAAGFSDIGGAVYNVLYDVAKAGRE